jgi:hypothetical protein
MMDYGDYCNDANDDDRLSSIQSVYFENWMKNEIVVISKLIFS